MFVSFVVPVYNAEKYISECLNSLLDQDVDSKEYEIICVNDGSTDNSGDIIKQYQSKHSNITLINQLNTGVCSARNAGLEIARGDFIWFVDADDFIDSNILATAKKESASIGMLTVGCFTFNQSLSEDQINEKNNHSLKANLFGNDVYCILHLFKTSFLKNNNLSFHHKNLTYSEDQIFVYEVKRCNPRRKRLDNIIYYYRRNPHSTTSRKMDLDANLKRIHSHEKTAQITYEYYVKDKNTDFANIWMSNLWSALYELSLCPKSILIKEIKLLKEMKQWPAQRPKECNLKKSYMTSRTDFIGKTFDWIYMHSHIKIGFYVLLLWTLVIRQKNRIAQLILKS